MRNSLHASEQLGLWHPAARKLGASSSWAHMGSEGMSARELEGRETLDPSVQLQRMQPHPFALPDTACARKADWAHAQVLESSGGPVQQLPVCMSESFHCLLDPDP